MKHASAAPTACAAAAATPLTADPAIPVLSNGEGLNKPGPCVICRQNDSDDWQWPIDILCDNELWIVHNMYNAEAWGTDDAVPFDTPMGPQPVYQSPLAGHLLFHARRHVHGPTDFNDEE